MSITSKIFVKTFRKRTLFFLTSDVLLICFSVWLAFLLRFDGTIPAQLMPCMIYFMVLVNVVTLPIFHFFGLYHFTWHFISMSELLKLARAIAIDFLFIGAILFFLRDGLFAHFPRSILIISGVLAFLTTGGIRFLRRIVDELSRKPKPGKRLLIVGAGKAGEELARNILRGGRTDYRLVGFIDDDPSKQNLSIHGVRVLGKRKDIGSVVKRYDIKVAILSFPSAPSQIVRETVQICRQAGLEDIKIIPSLREIIDGKVTLSSVQDISVTDLLGRTPVSLNTDAIAGFLSGKKVLVTGAAGSIGKELCRQILNFSPAKLIAIDQNETGVFYLERELKAHNSIKFEYYIGDICNRRRLEYIFREERPQIVFHAAAYKHVPVMEKNVCEAVRNNIFGTKNVVDIATKFAVENFVFISTDKAVNPTSVMGATKRIGEMMCLLEQGTTKFCAVRFGNVLDSQGNVIEILREQIKKGGPLTLTHPEMRRYFMVTKEACLLVMEAGARSKGGEIFLLNMGEPIKIVDLANEMVRLSGLEPDKDIPIVFTGQRPGEKLFEEIYSENETTKETEDIFLVNSPKPDKAKFDVVIKKLQYLQYDSGQEEILKLLKELVPEFNPSSGFRSKVND